MVATAYAPVLTLPAQTPRPRGLLIGTATDLSADAGFLVEGTDRLGLGVKFQGWGCDPLLAGNSDCDAQRLFTNAGSPVDSTGDYIDDEGLSTVGKGAALNGFPDEQTQPAFLVVDGISCSTLSFPDINALGVSGPNRIRARMRLLMSNMLTSELVTGWASQGNSLASTATSLTASTDMDEVAQRIEGHLAATLKGVQGTVVIPPTLLHQAIEADWVLLDNGALRTATGHKVIADSGYLGDPADPSDAGPATFTIYAAPEVFYRVGPTRGVGWDVSSDTFDWETNMRDRLAEARAQLLFDSCAVGSTVLTLS